MLRNSSSFSCKRKGEKLAGWREKGGNALALEAEKVTHIGAQTRV